MELTFTIDANAFALVISGSPPRPLGTAFAFLKPTWFITAKHVVVCEGLRRPEIFISTHGHSHVPVEVIFVHPEIDIAVLQTDSPVCLHPLYPAHHSIVGSQGLVYAGFAPSRSTAASPTVLTSAIPEYEVETRERGMGDEETIVFSATESEGGNSGGPVLGDNGAVVAVIIQNFERDGRLTARATSILPLNDRLSIA